jgi:prepilin-type N-terminal cleavage/methylation domain-containing protein
MGRVWKRGVLMRANGFTALEMMIVMVIVGVMV